MLVSYPLELTNCHLESSFWGRAFGLRGFGRSFRGVRAHFRVGPLGFRWAGVRGSKNLELDPRHRAAIAQTVRLREEEKLGWREISDRLEEQPAAEGRKPRPMSEREWDPSNARRCYARTRDSSARRRIKQEWRRRRQGGTNGPLPNGPV